MPKLRRRDQELRSDNRRHMTADGRCEFSVRPSSVFRRLISEAPGPSEESTGDLLHNRACDGVDLDRKIAHVTGLASARTTGKLAKAPDLEGVGLRLADAR